MHAGLGEMGAVYLYESSSWFERMGMQMAWSWVGWMGVLAMLGYIA